MAVCGVCFTTSAWGSHLATFSEKIGRCQLTLTENDSILRIVGKGKIITIKESEVTSDGQYEDSHGRPVNTISFIQDEKYQMRLVLSEKENGDLTLVVSKFIPAGLGWETFLNCD